MCVCAPRDSGGSLGNINLRPTPVQCSAVMWFADFPETPAEYNYTHARLVSGIDGCMAFDISVVCKAVGVGPSRQTHSPALQRRIDFAFNKRRRRRGCDVIMQRVRWIYVQQNFTHTNNRKKRGLP